MGPPEWAAAAAAAARLRAPGTALRVQQERGAQGPLAVRGREVLRAQEALQEPGGRVARERGELAARAGARGPPPAEPPGARELPEAQPGRQASAARLREREGTPVSREAPERREPQRVLEVPGQRETRERQERQAPEVQEPPGSEEPPAREGTSEMRGTRAARERLRGRGAAPVTAVGPGPLEAVDRTPREAREALLAPVVRDPIPRASRSARSCKPPSTSTSPAVRCRRWAARRSP